MAQEKEPKIETKVAPPAQAAKAKRGKEEWSSQYSSYTTVLSINGESKIVRFLGNKLVLDLDDDYQSKLSEAMHASSRNHIDFEVIRDNAGADVEKQAITLRKLYEMSEATLARLIGPEELKKCGLPPNCDNKEKLIVAFLKTKTLG